MSKFRFKLHAVEQVRKNKEQDALRSLAEAQRALQAESELKDMLVSGLNSALDRRERLGAPGTTSVDFAIEEAFISGSKIRIQAADRAIARASRALEKAMAHYLYCRQQRRMIDKLRERALEEHKHINHRRENRAASDLSVMRARLSKGVA